MPTHNRGDRLNRAIKSVENQTFPNWELIVVDNRSTDNTKEVVSDFITKDDRIIYLYSPEKGVSSARNHGISTSKGSYVCFLDDDDLFLPNHLKVLEQSIIKNKFKEAFYKTFGILKFDSGVEEKQNLALLDKEENQVDYLLTHMTPINCICISKSILRKFKFDQSLVVAEDCHLWLRIASQYPVVCIPRYTCIYNIGSGSASAGSVRTYQLYIHSYKYIFKDINVKGSLKVETKNRILAKQYFWLMMEYANEKKLFELLKSYYMFVRLSKSLKELKTFLSVLKNSLGHTR